MMKYTIRKMMASELKDIFQRIELDFTQGEYAPYDVLYQQIQKGVQEGLIFCEGDSDVAYSICAGGNTNGYVLISLFAVYEEFRGGGIGSAFLKELIGIYLEKQGILIEVEKPEDAKNSEQRVLRSKRIKFYESAGFYLIPNIGYSIWDVPLHLMALPHKASKQVVNEKIGQIMYEIYLELMGKRYIHKMKLSAME